MVGTEQLRIQEGIEYEWGIYKGVLLCPVRGCGGPDNYFHVMDVGLQDGNNAHRFRGTRGVQASVSVEGECGHNFDVVFSFHKGQTFVGIDNLKGEGGRSCSHEEDGLHRSDSNSGKYCLCGSYK
jgi:hypothetical protein